MKTLIIDNYDSFTYNLFQLIAEINNEPPLVIKNNELTWQELQSLEFDNIVISPGPGNPDKPGDFGICKQVILESKHPILGVCLGHQGIYSAFGGKVIHAPLPMHGRISYVVHQDKELFKSIPAGFNVVRYHSFMACPKQIPAELEVTSTTEDGLIMGVRHKQRPLWGLQFHPESICTEYGNQLLKNFNLLTQNHTKSKKPSPIKKGEGRGISKPVLKELTHSIEVHPLTHFPDPLKVFNTLYKNKKNSIWLDSSKRIEDFSRFSFMGCADGPLSYSVKYDVTSKQVIIEKSGQQTKHDISIFTFLKQELARYAVTTEGIPFQFNCGFVGYLGYELKSETCPVENRHRSEVPDAQFVFLDRLIAFDHLEKKCYLLALTPKDAENSANVWFQEIENKLHQNYPAKPQPTQLIRLPKSYFSRDYATYIDDINQCLAYINDGESYEICLTNKIKYDCAIDPYQYYMALRHLNPSPYAAFLNFNEFSVASSSIERYLHIDSHGNVETKPIKGTLPRGKSPEADRQLIHALKNSEKFRSENLMIVDLLRNDIGTICEIGSVHVPYLMEVETYQSVHQLVSTIRGELKADKDAVDCIKATFPGGSMTGAPKIRTMNIIDTLENEARGVYSGTIGYLALNGSADLNIVIRTAVITARQLSIGVGGAIISLSDSEEEFQEILLKANLPVRALEHYANSCEEDYFLFEKQD
jgi:para-aminobenzoate synthetase